MKLLVQRGGSLSWFKVSEDEDDSLCKAIMMLPTEYDLLLRVLKLRNIAGRTKTEGIDWCVATNIEVRTFQTQAAVGSKSDWIRSTWVQIVGPIVSQQSRQPPHIS